MIRGTLAHTKSCTFSIHLNIPQLGGRRMLRGTGFFVSAEGHFVTAAHVVTMNNQLIPSSGAMLVMGEGQNPVTYQGFVPKHIVIPRDFALFKLEPAPAALVPLLGNYVPPPLGSIPCLQISTRVLDDGEPVYSFGYPLPMTFDVIPSIVHVEKRNPRTTSAVVAGRDEMFGPNGQGTFVSDFVIDKALNFGNSGGPVVSTETGRVFAFCKGFQTMAMPQPRLTIDSATGALRLVAPNRNPPDQPLPITVPSLYSMVPFLGQPAIIEKLAEFAVPLVND
jgi:serine protease Do